jgi:replicative DNA helicase
MWSKGIKAIARDVGFTMLPVALLSRYVEHRDDKRPVLADLRGSGQIEQDADVVMFIWHKDNNMLRKIVSVDKNRNGPLAEIEYKFNNTLTLFTEMPIEVEG